jgi:hypothetical protein
LNINSSVYVFLSSVVILPTSLGIMSSMRIFPGLGNTSADHSGRAV